MAVLYSISYIVAVLALLGWFYFRKKQPWNLRFRQTFFLSLIVFMLSIFLSRSSFGHQLWVLFRDLVILAATGLVFQLLTKQRLAFLIGLLFFLPALSWYYSGVLRTSFKSLPRIELDENGELLVELEETETLESIKSIFQEHGLRAERAFQPLFPNLTELDDYYVIDVPDAKPRKLKAIKKDLRKSGVVDWMEDNEVITIDEPVAGKRTTRVDLRKFGINDPGVEQLWGFEAMEIDKLFQYLKENQVTPQHKALIAILDTGVDAQHEDLKDNYRSLQSKYNDDPKGHGTHCAGIAGAVSNNGVGVASFSQNNGFVQITSIKVLNAMGSGTQRTIINGIIEAADKGASVISLSLGGFSNQSKQTAYRKAVEYANKAGAIVVAAAGNANRNARDFSPVNVQGVLGVSAIDEELNRASFSNYVTDIERGVAAPGVSIYSTIPGNKYASYNGTSMATPYVSGLVGLMKSIRPSLTTQEVYQILKESGKETRNPKETGKLIQPHAALKQLTGGN